MTILKPSQDTDNINIRLLKALGYEPLTEHQRFMLLHGSTKLVSHPRRSGKTMASYIIYIANEFASYCRVRVKPSIHYEDTPRAYDVDATLFSRSRDWWSGLKYFIDQHIDGKYDGDFFVPIGIKNMGELAVTKLIKGINNECTKTSEYYW